MLDDLVGGGLGAAALDEGIAVAFEGERVLAHLGPPDVGDGAAALAVDPLQLVLADDGVLERPAVLDQEHGVLATPLHLPRALDTAPVRLHAAIKSAGYFLGSLVCD